MDIGDFASRSSTATAWSLLDGRAMCETSSRRWTAIVVAVLSVECYQRFLDRLKTVYSCVLQVWQPDCSLLLVENYTYPWCQLRVTSVFLWMFRDEANLLWVMYGNLNEHRCHSSASADPVSHDSTICLQTKYYEKIKIHRQQINAIKTLINSIRLFMAKGAFILALKIALTMHLQRASYTLRA